MAFRTSALGLSVLVLALGPGCSLPRSTLGGGTGFDGGIPDTGRNGLDVGPPVDTGVPPHDTGVPPTDTGTTTCPTSCDDANPCTDDACDTSGTCTHTSNAVACDDGVFCNGGDTCGGGTCSVHDGVSPCASPLTCDATSDTCTGCLHTSDCPSEIDSAWSACDFGGDLCATGGGMQTRTVMTFTCHSGTCVAATTTGMQGCSRPSQDGIMCAAPTYSDWSMCDFGTDPCTQMGTQVRTVTTSVCAGGNCVGTGADEAQACMRGSTDGTSCGDIVISAWSACMVGSSCATTGTQTQTTSTPTCSGGACTVNTVSTTQACTTGTTGSACGATTCLAWSACVQTTPNSCDRTGTQTRSCSTPTCTTDASASCTATTPSTQTQPCTFDVSGHACHTTSCGGCYEPASFGCRSGHNGSRRCSTSDGTCMDWGGGPFCFDALPSSSNVSCMCPP